MFENLQKDFERFTDKLQGLIEFNFEPLLEIHGDFEKIDAFFKWKTEITNLNTLVTKFKQDFCDGLE